MPRDVPSERRSWLLQRRDVLSQRQMMLVFATLCGPTMGISIVFLYFGYWHMLAYALLEMATLGACLRHYARHLDDYDRIDISENGIVVEQRRANRRSRLQLDLWTTRLLPSAGDGGPIRLDDRNDHMVVLGSFLGAAERRHLAAELGQCLREGPS